MNNAADVWKSVLTILKDDFGLIETTLKTWFYDVEAYGIEDETLILVAPEYKKETIEKYYTQKVNDALFSLFSLPFKFEIRTPDQIKGRTLRPTPTYADYTFDKFIVGSSNKFAHAAAKAVADNPGQSYNPLLIHGESGLGKTHLLYAIANTIQQSNPDANIVYIKSEDFTIELIDAIKTNTNHKFREKYRKADVLLVDDIQFIAGKDSTQEEFFHTFNALYEARCQMVFTSDRRPKDMPKLEDRLKTRFEWGLLADIEPPDFETRMAIVELKAQLIGLNLTLEQKELIANNVTANVRQLEGAVHKLLAYRDLLQDDISGYQAAERAILDIFAENPWINPTPEFIIKAVAKYFEITVEDILGKSKTANIAEARKIAMYMVRDMTDESYPKMGKVFGKDHTTVKYNVDSLEEQLKTDSALRDKIQDVKNSVLAP